MDGDPSKLRIEFELFYEYCCIGVYYIGEMNFSCKSDRGTSLFVFGQKSVISTYILDTLYRVSD